MVHGPRIRVDACSIRPDSNLSVDAYTVPEGLSMVAAISQDSRMPVVL